MTVAIVERVRRAENLPSLPSVAIEVLRLTRDENISIADLGAVIQNDPALTAKILKLINSPLFGMPRRVTSVSQAMNLLGWRSVRVMALSFSLVDVMKSERGSGFDYEHYWRLSLTTAVAGRMLAKAAGSRLGEEAFIGGLLSEIGRIAAARCAPEMYGPVLARRSEKRVPFERLERELLGVTHAELGQALLSEWGLPKSLCAAVGSHHGDGLDKLAGEDAELARIVRSAALIAGMFCGESPAGEIDAVRQECRASLAVGEEALENALAALGEQVRATAALMSVQIGEVQDYSTVQMEAVTRLTNLSMQAESERLESARREKDAQIEANRLRKERQEILRIASTDSLTKIPNRAALDERLASELDLARDGGYTIAVAMIDIDHFKRINDVHGHQAGDAALRAVAEALHAYAGVAAGFVARYGGEEFAMILTRDGATNAPRVIDELRRIVEKLVVSHDGATMRVTASFGVAIAQGGDSDLDPEQLLERADRRLYEAKHNGRNRVESDKPGTAPGGTKAVSNAA